MMIKRDELRVKLEVLVPGKQITLAQIIGKPNPEVYAKLGLSEKFDSIGVMKLTPKESAIIAGDLALKYGRVEIAAINRLKGTLLLTGKNESVVYAVSHILRVFQTVLGFEVPEITRS
ncbi:BMC domain-containing protein [Sporolactobacillus shoreicorticis]|uniref:BMC domain-containing protein n=1 Tax=Sporolactobacillus shoreicorticis TaxID=1923877 RepID=A0ABW5S458_9BACL|nr:BMC domain-containing protein [Sporolactobacillus shoreicorticis]MCO7124447.1 BMC domain-containing protein [Sporolactobacillus shoreicorticis]